VSFCVVFCEWLWIIFSASDVIMLRQVFCVSKRGIIFQVIFDYTQDKLRAVFFLFDSKCTGFFKLFFISLFIQVEHTLACPVKLLRRAVLGKKMLSELV